MAIVNMIDNEAPVRTLTVNDIRLPEKKLLVSIGIVFTGVSAAITVASILSLSKMQRHINELETLMKPIPVVLVVYRIVVVFLIVFAFTQFFINIPLTIALIKENVGVIYRVNFGYTTSSLVMCGAFWILVLSIFLYEMQLETGLWIGVAVFIGGFLQAGLIIYYFITVEAQKTRFREKDNEPEGEEEIEATDTYKKF